MTSVESHKDVLRDRATPLLASMGGNSGNLKNGGGEFGFGEMRNAHIADSTRMAFDFQRSRISTPCADAA